MPISSQLAILLFFLIWRDCISHYGDRHYFEIFPLQGQATISGQDNGKVVCLEVY